MAFINVTLYTSSILTCSLKFWRKLKLILSRVSNTFDHSKVKLCNIFTIIKFSMFSSADDTFVFFLCLHYFLLLLRAGIKSADYLEKAAQDWDELNPFRNGGKIQKLRRPTSLSYSYELSTLPILMIYSIFFKLIHKK